MTNNPDINTFEIIRLRQQYKRQYGPPSEWPDFVRERYADMKRENAELREYATA